MLKPSEQTPASTVRMAELLADVFPAGVLNVVLGDAATGSALVRAPGGGHGVADRQHPGGPARWRASVPNG